MAGAEVTMKFKMAFHLKTEKENFQDFPLKIVKWKTSVLWSFTSIDLGKEDRAGERK